MRFEDRHSFFDLQKIQGMKVSLSFFVYVSKRCHTNDGRSAHLSRRSKDLNGLKMML